MVQSSIERHQVNPPANRAGLSSVCSLMIHFRITGSGLHESDMGGTSGTFKGGDTPASRRPALSGFSSSRFGHEACFNPRKSGSGELR
jgi:hypothetical protein